MFLKITVFLLTYLATFGTSEPYFDDEQKQIYNFGLGKRAYSYVSEFKRLPVYNFGLGKRATEAKNIFSLIHNKQDDGMDGAVATATAVAAAAATAATSDELEIDKRSRGYDFGLGKRLPSVGHTYDFGKKALPQYSFGLGKRLGYYNFGLGKRLGKSTKLYFVYFM